MKRFIPILLAAVCIAVPAGGLVAAELDTVYRKSDGKSIAGEITSATRTEVVVSQRVGNREERIPANDIDRLEWKGEPGSLTLGRSHERSGNLQAALQSLEEARAAIPPGNPRMASDVEFLVARAVAKQALGDSDQLATAIDNLKKFVAARADHYRYYDAQLLLGELALKTKDFATAEGAFLRLEEAPWPDYQMAGQLGKANALLVEEKAAQAHRLFEEVARHKPTNAAERARRLEAVLGQATCLMLENQHAQAVAAYQEVIRDAPAEESRLLAQAYLQLGNCYAAASQQTKDAVLAYLHVDVIPSLSVHTELHAESLYHLSQLWPVIGHPARGAEAAARLEQEYPQSEWAGKLSSGSS